VAAHFSPAIAQAVAFQFVARLSIVPGVEIMCPRKPCTMRISQWRRLFAVRTGHERATYMPRPPRDLAIFLAVPPASPRLTSLTLVVLRQYFEPTLVAFRFPDKMHASWEQQLLTDHEKIGTGSHQSTARPFFGITFTPSVACRVHTDREGDVWLACVFGGMLLDTRTLQNGPSHLK
jgi:hypothetical protein